MILELQTRLLELAVKHGRNDINPGRPDGSLGKQTAWAINRFQMSCAQPAVLAEGAGFRVGPATARALKFGGRVDPRALVSS